MKRNELLRHLHKQHCILLREGAGHSIYLNPATKKQSAVPRHKELSDLLCQKICKQLEIKIIKR